MPASKKTQEFIEKELPYQILVKMYENSRTSLRELGKETGISYHVVHSVLTQLEKKYELAYVLDLNEEKMGFTEGRIATIKFAIKPPLSAIKEKLQANFFVQDAYLAEGDFDLLLYVVGLKPLDFQKWQWNIRTEFSEYKPTFKFANISGRVIGFFPLRNEFIKQCETLSKTEKEVLMVLNENSRAKIREIEKKTKCTQNKIIYIIKKMKERGVINKFSVLTQHLDKNVLLAYGASVIPAKEHTELARFFMQKLIDEDFHEGASDYALIFSTNGNWDTFRICAFSNGEVLLSRGPDMLASAWSTEEPKIEKAILTGVLVGKWPFHLEKYESAYKDLLK